MSQQITLEQILDGIRELGNNSDLEALVTIAEVLEEVSEAATPELDPEEGGEAGEGVDESEDDPAEIEVTSTDEVDHLTTIQLMMLSNAVTMELTDRALASEEDGEDDTDDSEDGDDNEEDEDGDSDGDGDGENDAKEQF